MFHWPKNILLDKKLWIIFFCPAHISFCHIPKTFRSIELNILVEETKLVSLPKCRSPGDEFRDTSRMTNEIILVESRSDTRFSIVSDNGPTGSLILAYESVSSHFRLRAITFLPVLGFQNVSRIHSQLKVLLDHDFQSLAIFHNSKWLKIKFEVITPRGSSRRWPRNEWLKGRIVIFGIRLKMCQWTRNIYCNLNNSLKKNSSDDPFNVFLTDSHSESWRGAFFWIFIHSAEFSRILGFYRKCEQKLAQWTKAWTTSRRKWRFLPRWFLRRVRWRN